MKNHRMNLLVLLLLFAGSLTACARFDRISSTPAATATVVKEGEPVDADLLGTTWSLEKLNGHPLLPYKEVTISFTKGDQPGVLFAEGWTSCNRYFRSIKNSPGEMTVIEAAITQALCPEVVEQEEEFSDTLRPSEPLRYEIVDGRLIITNDAGEEVLSFRQTAPNLLDTTWSLETLQDQPLLPGSSITISFSEDDPGTMHMEGHAGCNSYWFDGKVVGGLVSDLEGGQTDRLCVDPDGNTVEDLMEQEREYLKVLSVLVERYSLYEGQLKFSTDSTRNVLLEFREVK